MKKGDVIVFKERSAVLGGLRAVVLRKSQRTGVLTVELIEARGAFRKGETVNVAEYDVRIATETRSAPV